MPWLMKYHCLHIPFSEVRGSEKLFWKVSDRNLVASHSFPRPEGQVRTLEKLTGHTLVK